MNIIKAYNTFKLLSGNNMGNSYESIKHEVSKLHEKSEQIADNKKKLDEEFEVL